MKTALLCLVLHALFGAPCLPQQKQAQLRSLRAAKLAGLWLTTVPWFTDYDAARAAAQSNGQTILAYFTRSHLPCPPCKALEQGPFSDALAMQALAREFVLFCHVTSRVDDEPYPDLWHAKGGVAFPYLVFLDAAGEVLAEHQGDHSVADLRATGQRVNRWRELQRKLADGDPALLAESFVLEVELGRIAYPEAVARRPLLQLSPDLEGRLERALLDQEVMALHASLSSEPEQAVSTYRRLWQLLDAGKIPTQILAQRVLFTDLFADAEQRLDPAAFERVLRAMEQALAERPEYAPILDRYRRQLRDLQARDTGGGGIR